MHARARQPWHGGAQSCGRRAHPSGHGLASPNRMFFLASPTATPKEENDRSKFGHGVGADARGSDCCAPSQIFEDNPL
jgi:hypothetical protein